MFPSLSRRAAVLGAALLAASPLLLVTGASASAATPPVTAQLIGGSELTSTQSHNIVVRVTNPSATKGNTAFLNAIVIQPQLPAGGSAPLVTTDPSASSANGWAATAFGTSGLLFRPKTDKPYLDAPLPPGKYVDFTVHVTAAPLAQDTAFKWEVDTSSDGGTHLTQAALASGGNLNGMIRVLLNKAPRINFLTTSGNVTAGQSNLTLSQSVTNYGTAALNVTPNITGASGDGALGTPPTTTLLPGQTTVVTTPVVFGSPGTGRTLKSGFVATGATSFRQSTAPYDVQAPASFGYDGTNPLSPKIATSSSTQTFTLGVQKSGTPAVTLTAPTNLSFTDQLSGTHTFSAVLTNPTTVSGSQTLTFGPVTIPGNPTVGDWDGVYAPTLTLSGTDANGAPFSQTVGVQDLFTIDDFAPVTVPTLAAPNHVATAGEKRDAMDTRWSNAPYVAKNGDTLTFSGPIYTNGRMQSTSATAKVSCWVDSLSGQTVLSEQSVSCSNSSGQLSGSATAFNFASGATSAVLKVTTTDLVGLSSTTMSPPITVDNNQATFSGAFTGCGLLSDCKDTTHLRVFLDEPVTGAFNPSNFAVSLVKSGITTSIPVNAVSFTGTLSQFGTRFDLTLATPIGVDDRPTIRFVPSTPAPGFDQADNPMVLPTRADAVDDIAPPVPQLLQVGVSKPDPSDGSFYTNQESAPYTIGNTYAGEYSLTVYADTDGNPGLQPATDTVLCQTSPTSTTTTCADTTKALPADGTYPLYLVAADRPANNNPNVSSSTATEVLDRVAPTITGFTADASGITVQLSEPVPTGRDFAVDWVAHEGQTQFAVSTVAAPSPNGTVDLTQRRLSIASSTWAGMATSVTYALQTPDETQRYQDRAGNFLLDQTFPTG